MRLYCAAASVKQRVTSVNNTDNSVWSLQCQTRGMSAEDKCSFPLSDSHVTIHAVGGGSSSLPQYNMDSSTVAAPDAAAGNLFIERFDGGRDAQGR